MREVEAERANLTKQISDLEKRSKNLPSEVSKLKTEIIDLAASEARKIEEQSQALAKSIQTSSQERLAGIEREAQRKLINGVVGALTDQAKSQVTDKVDASVNQNLSNDAFGQIGAQS